MESDDKTASDPADQMAEVDRMLHATIGKATAGLSPTALGEAWFDWAAHLAGSPAKQVELWQQAWQVPTEDTMAADKRFSAPDWQVGPWSAMAQTFLKTQNWWDTATTGLHGVEKRHAEMVRFGARQWLDMMAPSNFFWTNPTVLRRTVEERGENLRRGMANWLADAARIASAHSERSDTYVPGKTVAVTEGDVVYRNDLMELIRYRPAGKKVQAEPLLIVPAWIMKYYILDLSPENSLVRFMVEQGFEVWMISWKNPGPEDAHFSMDDYVKLGVRAALDQIVAHVPDQKVHATGYCLGGTLLSIAAAALARDGEDPFASLTLLAAQVDFSEAGEITLFINESQVAFLEDIMEQQGFLRADQMSGAFQMLRSNDMIWSRVIRHYLLGERTEMNDLMAWNADSTRMPATMHSEYLRQLFLDNLLALGKYRVDDHLVALEDINAPIFGVGTEADHVAPWKSVWKVGRLTSGPMTFLLTSRGHNAGIVSEPGHPRRHYRWSDVPSPHLDAEEWEAETPVQEGSWWPVWADWLKGHGTGTRTAGAVKDAICPAPGQYVLIE